jgi:hypothetical protein
VDTIAGYWTGRMKLDVRQINEEYLRDRVVCGESRRQVSEPRAARIVSSRLPIGCPGEPG